MLEREFEQFRKKTDVVMTPNVVEPDFSDLPRAAPGQLDGFTNKYAHTHRSFFWTGLRSKLVINLENNILFPVYFLTLLFFRVNTEREKCDVWSKDRAILRPSFTTSPFITR